MKDKQHNDKAEGFDRMMRSMSAAIKNSALYPPGHPSLSNSINNFAEDLDGWLNTNDKLELGIAPDNLLVNGEYMRKEGSDLYAEVGSYFHQRGLIAVTFRRGVTKGELAAFFNIVKSDPKVCADSGGIAKNMPKSDHLSVREIDYRSLLKSSRSGTTTKPQPEDKDIWQSLVSLSADPAEELPVSKVEFIDGFLRNPERSATALNKVYKEALAKVDHKATVVKMRSALTKVAKYFQAKGSSIAQVSRQDMIDIILKLDPALVARLFEDEDGSHNGADLSDELMKALPDDAVADFIASLVGKEGGVNEQFVKLFDRLSSDNARTSNINTLVGDKLLNMSAMDKDLLLRLQNSFKDMLRSNPDSDFLNEIYKMTIDTFAESGSSQVSRSDEYMRIARETAEALKDDSIRRQEMMLILNLIWLERSPDQFAKLCDMVIDKFGALIDILSIQVIKDVYELFTAALDDKVKNDPGFKKAISSVQELIMSDAVINKIIDLARAAGPAGIKNISHILIKAEPNSACLVTDAYVLETEAFARDRMSHVMKAMGRDVLDELLERIRLSDQFSPEVTAGLLNIINAIDPGEARKLSLAMINDKESSVMLQALDIFTPNDPKDAKLLLGLLNKKIVETAGRKIITNILATRDQGLVRILFTSLKRGKLSKRYLEFAIKLCGDMKVQESFAVLRDIFAAKSIFYNKFIDSIRVAAIVSLAQLGTEDSMKLVKAAVSDRSDAVRRMSAIILELDKNDKAQK